MKALIDAVAEIPTVSSLHRWRPAQHRGHAHLPLPHLPLHLLLPHLPTKRLLASQILPPKFPPPAHRKLRTCLMSMTMLSSGWTTSNKVPAATTALSGLRSPHGFLKRLTTISLSLCCVVSIWPSHSTVRPGYAKCYVPAFAHIGITAMDDFRDLDEDVLNLLLAAMSDICQARLLDIAKVRKAVATHKAKAEAAYVGGNTKPGQTGEEVKDVADTSIRDAQIKDSRGGLGGGSNRGFDANSARGSGSHSPMAVASEEASSP